MSAPVANRQPEMPPSRWAALTGLLTAEVLVAAGLFVAAFALFFYLARVVFREHSRVFDDWGFAQFDQLRRPWLTWFIENILTRFGSVYFFVPASLLVPALLFRAKLRRYAIEFMWSMAGGIVLNELLKGWFHRDRPTSALIHQYGLSFPSGHAMMSVAFFGCLAWIAVQHGWYWGWAVALGVFTVLIGLTRIYLHVHYPTDVVAGFAAGLAWLVLLRTGLRLFWKEKQAAAKQH